MAEENQVTSTNVIETASSVISGKRKSSLRSNVWEDFKEIEGTNRVECKHCGKNHKCDKSKNGTSTLRNHIGKCTNNPNNESKKQKTLAFEKVDGTEDGKLVTVNFDPKVCRMACVEYIVCGELPFRHVENVAFKTFCFKLQPKFKPPSRTTVARDCYQLYLDMKVKLGKSIKKHRVSLTTDTWRSIQNINYMCVTAHFIDKCWVLHKRIINFFQVPNHKGETISRELETCMREWKIKKLCAITVDNASSNDAALNSLKRKLCSGPGSIVLEPKFLHLRCGAHIINLIVNEGLKEIEKSVACIRLGCKYVRSSTVRQQLFEECCQREGIETKALLCLDVATRWNSTYLMLDTAIRFQKAFDGMVGDGNYDNYFIEEGQQPPTYDDWEQAREYTEFLKTFYMATKKFSGSSYTTSNLFLPEIFDISQKLDKMINQADGNPAHCMMAIRMKKKFDKYWGDAEKISDVLFVAVVLDPRFKFKLLRHFYAKCQKPQDYIEAVCQKVEKLIKDLFNLYNKEIPQPSNDKQSTLSVPVEVEEQESDLFAEYADPDDSLSSKHEVDKYLNDSCEPYSRQFDILSWWRLNGHKYPILSHIARELLSVQVSTVSSESAFSGGGRILDSFRSSLHPRMVEALMCSRDWLLANRFPAIMDEECREELDNLLHSQSILAEMETMSIGSHSLEERLPSTISEDDDSEGDSD